MDKEKLKLIIRNMELLLDSLKAEIYSDVSCYSTSIPEDEPYLKNPFYKSRHKVEYDEIFDDINLNDH